MHVLVIDDDAATRSLLEKQLRANEYEVTLAENGLDGLMRLETLTPDVIVCDINMPKLNGLEFIKAIKDRQDTRAIPVIFLTSETDPQAMIKGINVGARYFLTKPLDAKELLWKIKRILAPPKT